MLKPVPDADLLSGKYGDIGGLVMIKRDMARARLAGSPGAITSAAAQIGKEMK